MPSSGTWIPVEPSLRRAPWFTKLSRVSSTRLGFLEYGGGASDNTSCEDGGGFWRGGNRGGKGGFGLGAGVAEGIGPLELWVSVYRTGGFGKFVVDKPVQSAL